jgi:hypothetical protein
MTERSHPWAVAASIPFAPEIVAPTISHLKALHIKVPNPYGFKASFNPVFSGDVDAVGWVSPYHFGINEGPTAIMIENHRTGLIWSLMRRCAPLAQRARARRLRRRLADRDELTPRSAAA